MHEDICIKQIIDFKYDTHKIRSQVLFDMPTAYREKEEALFHLWKTPDVYSSSETKGICLSAFFY